jgi:hypothetical protein
MRPWEGAEAVYPGEARLWEGAEEHEVAGSCRMRRVAFNYQPISAPK